MYDVVALGELLVDFIQNGSSQNGKNPLFEANSGGAPCNVLAIHSVPRCWVLCWNMG